MTKKSQKKGTKAPSTKSAQAPSTKSAQAPATKSGAMSPEVRTMNGYLKNELAAVDTFDMAAKSARDAQIIAVLQQVRDSHAKRAQMLRDRITAAGGQPAQSGGVSGTFRSIIQRGADLFGDRAAVAALEMDEDHLRKEYSEDLEKLDKGTQDFVTNQLLPEERTSHDLVIGLQKHVKAA